MSTLQQWSDAIAASTERVGRSVAAVTGGGSRFGASGFIWRPGVVVTTRSTLRRDDQLRVALPGRGESVAAQVAGVDPGSDLAVLRFEAPDASQAPELSAASGVRLGEVALAVGRAANTGPNVALGLVSAVGPPWDTWQGSRIDAYLRLDIHLAPGTSGAAVVNGSGEWIGILTGALSRIAPLAIPAKTVERIAAQLLARGTVARPWLGVAVQAVPLPASMAETAGEARHGLVVLGAGMGTPAADAGILIGDILLALDGAPLADPMDLRSVLSRHAPGDTVRVILVRGGERREVMVILKAKE